MVVDPTQPLPSKILTLHHQVESILASIHPSIHPSEVGESRQLPSDAVTYMYLVLVSIAPNQVKQNKATHNSQ